ncbi:secretin N-terminal domain-containing protein [Roseateles asaccharophilus]|uniref:General secretion pathway protein D n=2 Tax=Roseateles asaccharophilus TaxID=582607 RepID=A0ABU2ABY9_9BURK|nr:secretin N-terminal domain-containing protein [Roseateles asaccharophilus]MDR7334716.1 general secretion pathway protein D [Roseateles asaccharophilus]
MFPDLRLPRRLGMPSLAAMLVLSACAPLTPQIPPPLQLPQPSGDALKTADSQQRTATEIKPGPKAPETKTAPLEVTAPAIQPTDEVLAAVNLQQVALPTFIQVVYADVLKKNVSIDAPVLARQDLVTFKAGTGQTAAQIETAVKLLLKSYGLSVIDVAGLVRVVPDNASQGDLPGIRYGAALPTVPASLRPIFQLIPLESVRQVDVGNWLRTLFGERVKVQEDSSRNAILISGNPDNVRAALDALAVLDQPALKGRSSLTLSPAFWSADELARRLAEVLAAEGYAVHPVGQAITPGGLRSPIILLPVSSLNQVFVFATGEDVANHVAEWARTLDRPNERGIGKNLFTYAVKHKDAEQLATTLDRVLGGSGGSQAAATTGSAAAGAAAATRLSSVVVDKSSNTLIFQANPDEFGQILALLQNLDKPTKSALIEVTVAELNLTNDTKLGFEWLTDHVKARGGYSVSAGSGAGSEGGININIFNPAGAARVAIDALATDNRATILSSPRLMARNGESATIQVGDEVPIITAQQTTPVTGNTNGLLQTVQYRSTGVILKIKPVIHSGDQIDLDVSQEVSQPATTKTGLTTTPTISTRKVETKLTLRNGSTVLLAGLIDGSGSEGASGVPLLKDIPVIGSLFKSETKNKNRREMIILITTYIANDSAEAEAITEAFRKSLGPWANPPTKFTPSELKPQPVPADR